ncbi:hypothetical protein B9Z19DRAFT_1063144 [Tuber borchii]|uniref:Uncharacterized protein n=1 Tax=Tuber borchii TaxID=42251 RepID=A0A2T6ZZ90_TUBBO|nr:hypothetical protein B9Z19DRAFT_1063144 [Tuber borchii]
MAPRKKKQKANNAGGHIPLDIPATKNAGWTALAKKTQAHTKDIETPSSAADGSRDPKTDEYSGPRFDYMAASIINLFDRAVSASIAANSPIIPPGGFNQTNLETTVAIDGQMDPEQPKRNKHKLCPPGAHVAGSAPTCDTSAGEPNRQMGKSGAGTECEGEGGGAGGGRKYQVEDGIDAD